MTTLSVLLTTYHGTDVDALTMALDSLLHQTRPADHIVIVEDGPLSPAVAEAVQQFVDKHAEARRVVLAANQGSGPASQAGLTTIDSDFIARLDSDDVAAPERFAKQLAYFEAHPQVAVLGTAVVEFQETPGDADRVRALPESPHALRSYVKINSPINNPSVMMRTQAIKDVGGYRDVHHMEDYDLYARLISGGYLLANLPEPLTFFRVTPEQFQRRTGKEMFAAEKQMQENLVSYGLVTRPRAMMNLIIRTLYRSLPTGVLTRVYGALFHK
ncbi:glycosyltransferase [Corynebacterium breve]|uniref:Glycosyltransferase n=1 Tax=Corynebacterium breve TaxID=3049799 RepID=A0ABY8VG75_9CORY|nr:glycosyltransferase [Corynebacterium breve]WIM67971.1 glycosyltransferase [Corynebacterium breve]